MSGNLFKKTATKLADSDPKSISSLMRKEKYKEAIAQIRKELRKKKLDGEDDHWLLACLSACYHEQKKYQLALKYALQAVRIMPKCPLAKWYYATSCASLARPMKPSLSKMGWEKEAIDCFKDILKRGMNQAYNECGEGEKWTASMLNDCRYWLAMLYQERDAKTAKRWARLHLSFRDKGVKSMYKKSQVMKDFGL